MDNLKAELRRAIAWATATRTNLGLTALALVMAGALGVALDSVPEQVLVGHLRVVRLYTAQIDTQDDELDAWLADEGGWYAPAYRDPLIEASDQTDMIVVSLREQATAIEENHLGLDTDEQIAAADEVADTARAEAEALKGDFAEAVSLSDSRRSVRDEMGSAQTTLAEKRIGLSRTLSELVAEGKYHPRHYSDQQVASLNQTISMGNEANGHLMVAARLMPADEDRSGKGDPMEARNHIVKVESWVEESSAVTSSASALEDQLRQARLEAGKTVANGAGLADTAEIYFHQLESERGYDPALALVHAYSLLRESRSARERAEGLLTAREDGRTDYLSAFQTAQEAVQKANEAKSIAEAQVAADDESAQLLGEVADSRFVEVNNFIVSGDRDRETLVASNHPDTWSGVGQVTVEARQKLAEAQKTLSIARWQRAQRVQQYTEALASARSYYVLLTQASNLIQSQSDTLVSLERERSEWPSNESVAIAAINSAEGTVSSYSSYTYASTSSARMSLAGAQSAASNRRYADANEYAQNAVRQARSAANEAESDYQAHLAAERARKAAAEAAERAREAAEQAREQAARDAARRAIESANDYGGGGSNYGGGNYGGGHSDGGAFSGGYSDNNAFEP